MQWCFLTGLGGIRSVVQLLAILTAWARILDGSAECHEISPTMKPYTNIIEIYAGTISKSLPLQLVKSATRLDL